MRSLRLRLLAWLLPPLVVVAAVAAGGAYMFLERRLNAAYDHDLGDVARALVPYIRDDNGRLYIDFTPQAEAVLRADSVDQVYYAVLDASGKLLAGDRNMPVADPAPAMRAAILGQRAARASAFAPWCSIRLGAGKPVRVVAAETTRKRQRASRDALVSAIVPAVLLLVAALAGIVLGVGRGLRPLDAHAPIAADALAPGPAPTRIAAGGRRAAPARDFPQRHARAAGRCAEAPVALHRERGAPAAHADRGRHHAARSRAHGKRQRARGAPRARA